VFAEVGHETPAVRVEIALQREIRLGVQHPDIARLVQREIARPTFVCDEPPSAHEPGYTENTFLHVLPVVPLVEIALETLRNVGPDDEQTAHGVSFRIDATVY
jgi:hypothetical protein